MGQQLYIRTRKKHPAGCFFQQNDYLKKGGELINTYQPEYYEKNLISSIASDVSLFMFI